MKHVPLTLLLSSSAFLISCSPQGNETNVSSSNPPSANKASVNKTSPPTTPMPTPSSTPSPNPSPTPQPIMNKLENQDIPQSSPLDDLVGRFSTRKAGAPEILITKTDEGYFVSVWMSSGWSKPDKLRLVTEAEYKQFFGGEWKEAMEAGLNKGAFAIFKVKKGKTLQNHTFRTGYFVVFMGGGDVYKLE